MTAVSISANETQTDSNGDVGASTRPRDAFHNAFGALLDAVQSGDIATAQSALQTLPGATGSIASYSRSGGNAPPVDPHLRLMLSAVKAGDTAAAQSALQQLPNYATA